MIKIEQELIDLIDKLDKLYYQTPDPEEKQKLRVYQDNLSRQLRSAAALFFDQNDAHYNQAVGQLLEAREKVYKHLESQAKIVHLFKYIGDFVEQVDYLLFGRPK